MSTDAVKSAKRSLDILELLTSRESGLTFRQIGDQLGLPRSSLHGLLTTLVQAGWVEFNADRKTYWLGIRTLEAGNAYLRAMNIPDRALPFMERIRDAIDETVQLSVLEGRFNVYVGKVDGGQVLALASAVGRRLPAHATGVGKVLLAGLSQLETEKLLDPVELERFTDQTLTDKRQLYRVLEHIRECGYGTDEEEYTPGVRCIAVPLRAQHGEVVAAMSVSAPAFRLDAERAEYALALLRQASTGISQALGYRAAVASPA